MKTVKEPADIALSLALAAVFAALVCVVTFVFPISIPATNGYFNLGEIVIYVAALLFGPLVGSIAGGVGAAIADMLVSPLFAPGTLVIKCLEGAIVGIVNRKTLRRSPKAGWIQIIAMTAGGLEMIAGYFLYEQLILPSYATAMGTTISVVPILEIPFNVVQMIVGIIVATPITAIVLKVFPQLRRQARPPEKQETEIY